MKESDRQLLSSLWNRLTGEVFQLQELLTQVIVDGGHDFQRLSKEQIQWLFEGRFVGNWKEVGFSFSELLASYLGSHELGNKLNGKQVVAWSFTALVVADAIEQGALDLELQFSNFINGYHAVRGHLTVEESIAVFKSFFVDAANHPFRP